MASNQDLGLNWAIPNPRAIFLWRQGVYRRQQAKQTAANGIVRGGGGAEGVAVGVGG